MNLRYEMLRTWIRLDTDFLQEVVDQQFPLGHSFVVRIVYYPGVAIISEEISAKFIVIVDKAGGHTFLFDVFVKERSTNSSQRSTIFGGVVKSHHIDKAFRVHHHDNNCWGFIQVLFAKLSMHVAHSVRLFELYRKIRDDKLFIKYNKNSL